MYTKLRVGQIRTPGHTRVGNRCLWGISIPKVCISQVLSLLYWYILQMIFIESKAVERGFCLLVFRIPLLLILTKDCSVYFIKIWRSWRMWPVDMWCFLICRESLFALLIYFILERICAFDHCLLFWFVPLFNFITIFSLDTIM